MEVLLYTSLLSKRLAYISHYIFEHLLKTKVRLTTQVGEFQAYEGVKLNYSTDKQNGGALQIIPHSLLFESGIQPQNLKVDHSADYPLLFPNTTNTLLPFDPLAASFFILSRYEEYLPFKPDLHGRFTAQQSWAFRNQCPDRPIIWEWAQMLVMALQKHFPSWQPVAPGYRFLPTYDVDIPWAYQHRSWRGIGRAGLDFLKGNWLQLHERFTVLFGNKPDPYFVFDQLADLHQATGSRPRVFWLLGNASRYDINPSHQLPSYQSLIQKTSQWADIGIHPSYSSFGQIDRIKNEIERLENISQQEIHHSRQHFLRLRLPQTYRELLRAGIGHDYSMGYANQVGYRAGTSEAFCWYDLEKDQLTELWVHPFAVMDVTLKNYQQLSPATASQRVQDMQDYCKTQQLSFSTLWHNSSFSELHGWAGWWDVYLSLYR